MDNGDKKPISFRSPRNITEADINDAMNRVNKYEFSHCLREFSRATDAKEVYKFIFGTMSQGAMTFERLRHVMIVAMHIGFDVHAARADSGPASIYAQEEETLEKKAKADAALAAMRKGEPHGIA